MYLALLEIVCTQQQRKRLNFWILLAYVVKTRNQNKWNGKFFHSLLHPPANTTRREFSTTTYICLTVPYTGCLGFQFRDLQETVLKCNLAETLEECLVWTRNVCIEVNTIAILSTLGPHPTVSQEQYLACHMNCFAKSLKKHMRPTSASPQFRDEETNWLTELLMNLSNNNICSLLLSSVLSKNALPDCE